LREYRNPGKWKYSLHKETENTGNIEGSPKVLLQNPFGESPYEETQSPYKEIVQEVVVVSGRNRE